MPFKDADDYLRQTEPLDKAIGGFLSDPRPLPGWAQRFMDGLTTTRTVEVTISRSMERRLARHIESVNPDMGDDPLDPDDDDDLGLSLLAVADRGLMDGEDDDGVWTTPDGIAHPLPRARRSPWKWRLKFAWQAAVRTWRAT